MSDLQYFTQEGLQKLKEELENLKSVERPKVIQQIAEARDKGDLSENAEYDAAKEAQGHLEDRINKLEAIYGAKYVEALQDILYRMETGRNRPMGKNRLTNEFMNWTNGAIGSIMFFNIRSAVLQTISAANYINWTDNNPLKAGAALANQKQFWKDFVYIFNSDMLKQRRAGNRRGVNESELISPDVGALTTTGSFASLSIA